MSSAARRYDRIILVFLKAYALCSPLLYVRIQGNALAFIDVAAPFALLLIAARSFRHLEVSFAIFLAYVCAAVASTLTTELDVSGPVNVYLALRQIFIALPFWLAMLLASLDFRRYREIYRFALIGAGLAVAVGLLLHFMGISVQEQQQSLWLGRGGGSVDRAGGLLGNSGDYGMIAALFGVLLFSAPAARIRVPLPLQAAGWIMMVLALFVSSSRGGLLMLLAGVAVVALARPGKSLAVAAAAGLALVTVIWAMTTLAPQDVQAYFQVAASRLDLVNVTGEGRFFETVRLQTWASLLRQVFEVPLLGLGYKAFSDAFGELLDNSFLIAWFETGPVGFLLFTAFWIVLGLRLFAMHLRMRSPMTLIALAILAAFLVRMQTGGAHASWSVAPVAFLMIGLGMRHAREPDAGTRGDAPSAVRGAPA